MSTNSIRSSSPSSSSSLSPEERPVHKRFKRYFRSKLEINSPSEELYNHESNGTTSSDGSSKLNKENKAYVGIGVDSIKCIWDQNNDSEMVIDAEVLPILAEDATYRLWEFMNNLKIYTQNSGGKLTTDLVNEVLRDSDVTPIIGTRSANTEWNKIDYNGTYYYHDDEIINLRDEYLKEVTKVQSVPITFECDWLPIPENSEILTNLANSIILAIALGDNIAYNYAIHTVFINPFIGCILPFLMQKLLEFLSFDHTHECLERLLPFLKAIALNPHTRDVPNDEINFHLCQIFVNMLLGPLNIDSTLKSIEKIREENKKKLQTHIKQELIDDQQQEQEKKEVEAPPRFVLNPAAIKQEIIDEESSNNFIFSKQNIKNEPFDSGYQEYNQNLVINPISIIKLEPESEEPEQKPGPFLIVSGNIYEQSNVFEQKTVVKEEDTTGEEGTDGKNSEPSETYSPYETKACDDHYVPDVCTIIGMFANNWGYFEHETIYLLTKRLEIFFFNVEKDGWSGEDTFWMCRYIQVLVALGEFAFRELTQYFDWIPVDDEITKWINPYLNYATIFVRGRRDRFLYEFMMAMCGDGILPFLSYYTKTIRKLQRIYFDRQESHKENYPQELIETKVFAKPLIWIKPEKIDQNLEALFPDNDGDEADNNLTAKILLTNNKIAFRFAGCRPVNIKPKKRFTITKDIVQNEESLKKFNEKIVVAKRKLLKSFSFNTYGNKHLPICDYRMFTI